MRAVRPLPLRVLSSSRTRGLSSRAPPAASASLPPQSAVRRIREQLRSGEATAVALASAALERIAATDGALNAFVSTQREQALAYASERLRDDALVLVLDGSRSMFNNTFRHTLLFICLGFHIISIVLI